MSAAPLQPRNLEPPGGYFIWMLVILELLTFGTALLAFSVSASLDPVSYHRDRLLLNSRFGLANTIFLLTSGYFMARSLHHFRLGDRHRTRRALLLTLAGGGLFILLKSLEYSGKIHHGHTLGATPFFTWYWLLTVFHLMHVLVGLVILACLLKKLPKLTPADLETGGVFWHMCDLIWLLLFPALYLVV